MTRDMIFWLLLLSCVSLIGFGISAVLANKAYQASEKRKARLISVSNPRRLERAPQLSAITPRKRGTSQSMIHKGAMVFGLNLRQMDQYRFPWWMVLIVSLGVAKLVQAAAANLAGDASYLILPVAWVLLSRQTFVWMESRRKNKAVVQLPDILDQIVRSVRVGMPVLEALRVAALNAPEPSRAEFTRLVDQVSFGTPLEDAIVNMSQRCGLREYSFFATAISLQNQTGGTLSEALLSLAEVVRKRVAIVEKGRALSSEARSTAIVLTVLPFFTGFVLWLMNPDYMGLLFNQPIGHKMLAAASISLGLGLVTIRLMFQRALSLI